MKHLNLSAVMAALALCAGCASTGPAPSTRQAAGSSTGVSAPGSVRYGHPGEAIYDFPPGGYETHQRQKQASAQSPGPVPAVAPVQHAPAPLPPGPRTYVVQPGDSLWGIAKKHGVKVDQIRAANALPGDVIKPGQSLAIP
jgi:LysM repeat protein